MRDRLLEGYPRDRDLTMTPLSDFQPSVLRREDARPSERRELPRAQPGRLGELTVRQSRELALHAVHSREIAGHVVVAALLARGQAEAAPGELVAGAGPG